MRDDELRTMTPSRDGTPHRSADDPLKVAVIYYSATGSVHRLAHAVADGAREAGGSVRVVQVAETVPRDLIERNPLWARHVDETAAVPVATLHDVRAADVVLLGSPTRFGHVTSQLQAFIDTWGELWADNAFEDKVFAAFTASATSHGGQETTLMSIYTMVCHLGGIIVPPGYIDPAQFETGNPYGASTVSNNGRLPPTEADLRSAYGLGRRATSVARDLRLGRLQSRP